MHMNKMLGLGQALVNVGAELLKSVSGRVSTEVDARLSYDTQGIIDEVRSSSFVLDRVTLYHSMTTSEAVAKSFRDAPTTISKIGLYMDFMYQAYRDVACGRSMTFSRCMMKSRSQGSGCYSRSLLPGRYARCSEFKLRDYPEWGMVKLMKVQDTSVTLCISKALDLCMVFVSWWRSITANVMNCLSHELFIWLCTVKYWSCAGYWSCKAFGSWGHPNTCLPSLQVPFLSHKCVAILSTLSDTLGS